tara:strand:- start:174 stop:1427 length:1254 start_codon:yes stop_codon:yes gene_type:complete
MEQESRLAVAESPFELPSQMDVANAISGIRLFREAVHRELRDGEDFGTIPGTPKPSMWKPGAEKIVKLLRLTTEYHIVEQIEQWDVPVTDTTFPLFYYKFRCDLSWNGIRIDEGWGSANSYEVKYRWRESKRRCPDCGREAIIKSKAEWGGGWVCHKKQGGCGVKRDDGDREVESQTTGRVPNEAVHDQINTLLKMGKKRSLIDGALSVGRLSDVFTQDIEDLPRGTVQEATPQPAREARPVQETPRAQRARPTGRASKTPTPLVGNVTLNEKGFESRVKAVGWTPEMVRGFLGMSASEWVAVPGMTPPQTWVNAWNECVDRSQDTNGEPTRANGVAKPTETSDTPTEAAGDGNFDEAWFRNRCQAKGLSWKGVVDLLGAEPVEWMRGPESDGSRSWEDAWLAIESEFKAQLKGNSQ